MADTVRGIPEIPGIETVVIIPMHRECTGITMWSVEKAHMVGVPFIALPQPGDALIGRARSILATWVLEYSPYPYAIFLDSDIVFEPKDLAKLIHDLKQGYDLIGGVYTVRHAKQVAHWGYNGKLLIDGSIKEVEFLSTGFTGFSKKMLKSIVDELKLPVCHPNNPFMRCYPFFENNAYDLHGEMVYLSEDWDFCVKARKAGYKAYVDTSIRLGHQGSRTWTLDDLPTTVSKVSKNKLYIPDIRDSKSVARELLLPGSRRS